MNTQATSAGPIANQTNTTQLVSLLALATGAVAIPQTGQADIIYTDMNSSPVVVGWVGGVDSFLFNLPGTTQTGFQRRQGQAYSQANSTTVNYRLVLAGDIGGGAPGRVRGNGAGIAAALPVGATWNQGVATYLNIPAGIANDLGGLNPLNGYDHQYLAWNFDDSTQSGATRYGWVEVSLSVAAHPTGPAVTVWGYGWDNTGAKPTMGQTQVPEPSAAALMAVGALMLGARGLRNWRNHRETAGKA